MKHLILVVSSLFILSMNSNNSFAFFFGGNNGGGGCSCNSGCPSYSPCPSQPICNPQTYSNCEAQTSVVATAYPSDYSSNFVQDCCATCPQPCRMKYIKQIFSQKRRQKRETDELLEEEINITEDDTPATTTPEASFPNETEIISNNKNNNYFNSKCNSERLRNIIVMSKGRDITIIKRNIQLLAETQFNRKYNIICSADGDFSYITNTDEHCQDIVNGNICYIFRQAKRLKLRS